MHTIRKWFVVAAMLVAVSVTAVAAPQRDQDQTRAPRQRDIQQKQKPQKPGEGIVAKLLDDLQSKLSIPPG
jgi:hypothetical protein